MLDFRRGGIGYVLIKTDSVFEDVTDHTGIDGRPIMADVTFDRAKRVRIYGTVIQTPVSMGSYPIIQIPSGYPGYGAIRMYKDHEMDDPHIAMYRIGSVNKYKLMSDIAQEVMIGDKIYFKWRVMYGKQNMLAKSHGDNPEYIFKVPYDHIFCSVREGEIIPIGSHVLIDPQLENIEDTLVKTYYDFKDSNGNAVERPKNEWIKTKPFPENKDRIGIVFRTGTPLKGDGNFLQNGMKVIYKNQLKNMIIIENRKFIVLRQNKILAKVIK